MLQAIKRVVNKYGYLILPIMTLLFLTGFVGSYLFPNEVLDTYRVNMTEEENDTEFYVPLSMEEDSMSYVMQTDGRAMKGIQIGISKNGELLEGCELLYRVYQKDTDELLYEGVYDLESCLDGQYPYLPFDNDNCIGKLKITFSYRYADGIAVSMQKVPSVYFNHTDVKDVQTYVQGELYDGNMKTCYIYSHNTYPLLYDCRVMTFVCLAASVTVCYPKFSKRKKKGEKLDEENN